MLSQTCQFYAKYFEGPFQLKINAYHELSHQQGNRFLTNPRFIVKMVVLSVFVSSVFRTEKLDKILTVIF